MKNSSTTMLIYGVKLRGQSVTGSLVVESIAKTSPKKMYRSSLEPTIEAKCFSLFIDMMQKLCKQLTSVF